MELLSNPAVLALIGTVFGGAGLKIIEHWLSKTKVRDDTATHIRDELRVELQRLKEDLEARKKEINDIELEMDGWRQKYYELFEQYINIRGKLSQAIEQLRQNNLIRVENELDKGPDTK